MLPLQITSDEVAKSFVPEFFNYKHRKPHTNSMMAGQLVFAHFSRAIPKCLNFEQMAHLKIVNRGFVLVLN